VHGAQGGKKALPKKEDVVFHVSTCIPRDADGWVGKELVYWPTLRALEQVARNLFWPMLAWISGCPSSSGSQLSLAWIGPTVCDRTLCDRYVIGPYCGDSFGQMGRRGDNTTLRHGTQDRTNFALLLAL
jgi:hypothetical protein